MNCVNCVGISVCISVFVLKNYFFVYFFGVLEQFWTKFTPHKLETLAAHSSMRCEGLIGFTQGRLIYTPSDDALGMYTNDLWYNMRGFYP